MAIKEVYGSVNTRYQVIIREKCYISAYEATVQRSTGKLASVVNTSADYRGGNNQADWDALPKTQLGKPATYMSRTAFRTAARKRGTTTEWNCMDYNAYITLAWLYYIEYGNLNCQLAFNAQKDSNGYAQGGLGNGVTTWDGTKWNNFSGYYPIIPCGTSDELGNASGEVAYTLEKQKEKTVKSLLFLVIVVLKIHSGTSGNGRTG